MSPERRELLLSIGLLVLRVGIGTYLMIHGSGKVGMVLAGEFDKFADPIGIGVAPSLVLAAGAEFFCSLLVMLGLGTRFAAVPVVFTMAVAAFVVHAGDPWTLGAGRSKEPALLFLIPFLALAFTGAGRFSLDAWLGPRVEAWWAKRRAATP